MSVQPALADKPATNTTRTLVATKGTAALLHFHEGCAAESEGKWDVARTQFRLAAADAEEKGLLVLQLNANFQVGKLLLLHSQSDADKSRGVEILHSVVTSCDAIPPTALCSADLHTPTSVSVAAQYLLGNAYSAGLGVPCDLVEAEKWWLLAAREGRPEGSPQAQLSLGVSFTTSRAMSADDPLKLTPPNWAEAKSWLTVAAQRGVAPAMCELGLLYFKGLGVKKDEETAMSWLRKASEAGHLPASVHLMKLYYGLRLYNKAVEFSLKLREEERTGRLAATVPAELCAEACFYLGRCFERGIGTLPASMDEAMICYKTAVKYDTAAAAKLRLLVTRGELA